jgi:hypothetical protein
MNWLAELGIILFTFNALLGPLAAVLLAVLYLLWSGIKTITAYRMANKLTKNYFAEIEVKCNGNKRSKSRAKN